MVKVNSINEINEYIKNNPITILYFTGFDCGACEAIKFKVENILKEYPKITGIELSGEKYPEIAANFNVFSLPLLILFVNKKETLRYGRAIDLLEFEKTIYRYNNLLD
ncbi:MAG: thioredoxin family protein [Clostridium sp.]|uniref:thioredoxin family protein n=1 Tax=Clostridium sp. TaxID=1506 RepID=UPI003F3D4661